MRATRGLIAVIAVITVGWLASSSAAAPKPTLTLTPVCQGDFGPTYTVDFSGTGWPPNTLVTLKATTGFFAIPGVSVGSSTDASGNWSFSVGLFGPDWGFSTFELFVDTNNNQQLDPGELYAIARIDNPCGPPTLTKESCKNGGYSALRFGSQGECVAFVQRGSKP